MIKRREAEYLENHLNFLLENSKNNVKSKENLPKIQYAKSYYDKDKLKKEELIHLKNPTFNHKHLRNKET